MNTLTKSPLKVARQALAVGAQALRVYSHKNSPKKFTQPQLFSCLALKTFFKTDYRGLEQLLADLPELSDTLGLGQNNAHLLPGACRPGTSHETGPARLEDTWSRTIGTKEFVSHFGSAAQYI
jgi:hypothetical protein